MTSETLSPASHTREDRFCFCLRTEIQAREGGSKEPPLRMLSTRTGAAGSVRLHVCTQPIRNMNSLFHQFLKKPVNYNETLLTWFFSQLILKSDTCGFCMQTHLGTEMYLFKMAVRASSYPEESDFF